MLSKLRKIINTLPFYPHFKMNVCIGTNRLSEITNTFSLIFSSQMVNGADESKYKKNLEIYLPSSSIYLFASERMGFYSILKMVEVADGDEVIIPSFSCIVVANAVKYAGATTIYCDIKNDFNIDVEQIEKLITPNTKIIYAQYTFGQMCNIEAIVALAKKYNLLVIEDVALALGAKWNHKKAGTIGDFGYFSTDRSKVINTGIGGFVSVNNSKYVNRFGEYYQKVPYLDEKLTRKIA